MRRILIPSFVTLIVLFSFSALAQADTTADTGVNPAACDQLFNLPGGTIQFAVDKSLMNPTVCAAYQFLISRYTPGPCSQKGLANPQVEGITKLTPDFAVNLAAMLKAAPMQIGIISAFRTQQAQQCANPKVENSNHSKGCAVDLAYDQNSCTSAACQWVKANAANFKLQLRLQVAPEWNHLEPQQCNGQGLGPVTASNVQTPTSGITSAVQNVFRPQPVAQPAPAPIATPPQITSATPPTTIPTSACTPQYSCTNGAVYYQSSSCTTSVFQTCQNGCSGTTCALSSTTISTAPSALSLLQQLAGPTVSSSTATTTPLSLNAGIYNIVQGNLGAQSNTASTSSGQVVQYSVYGSQTFTSSDLSGSGSVSQSYTPLQQLLVSLKTALSGMLPYLHPFGGQVSVPVYAE